MKQNSQQDIQSAALEIEDVLSNKLNLPSGYYIQYGGTSRTLKKQKRGCGLQCLPHSS
jgi:Cu/Ag efflux pump CusA